MSEKYTLRDLPVKIELNGAVRQDSAPYVAMVLGAVVLLFCGGLMFWGPDQVSIDPNQGMTLWQSVQVNPGLYALIGGATINLGSVWLKARGKKLEKLIYQQLAFSKEELPAGKQLSVTAADNGRYRVGLINRVKK